MSPLLAVPGLAFLIAFHFAGPIAGGYYAFTSWDGLGAAHWIGLKNFRDILGAGDTRGALIHTLELAGAFLVLNNAIGLGLALALNRTLKTRNFLRSLFFLPAAITPLAVSYVWQFIFDFNGPLNQGLGAIGLKSWERPWLGDPGWALWTVLVVMVWQFSGIAMVIYLAGLQSIPEELDEAAAIDGARPLRRFRTVTLPLLAPAMTVASTLSLIFGLRVFDQVIALTNGGPVNASETLATQIWKQTFVFGRFGYGAALSLILALLMIVLAVSQLLVLRRREAAI